jgi:methionine-S-sulfoxide reductase
MMKRWVLAGVCLMSLNGMANVTGGGQMEKAIFAAGCFWGVEAILQEVPGVMDTTVGYTGGRTENPTYKQVCYTDTGHAEAVEVVFDPTIVSYEALLRIFWRLHDPTTKDRQGPDRGSQYRSAVFYLNDQQRIEAEQVMKEAQLKWKAPIVTEIKPAGIFYAGEEYHQDYFKRHGGHGCHFLRD